MPAQKKPQRRAVTAPRLDLPPVIWLGRWLPPEAPPWREIPEVASADDLPPRLFLGDLDRDTVSITPEGWSARYVDNDPSTHVQLRYTAADGQFRLESAWQGITGSFAFLRNPTWRRLVQLLFTGYVDTWETAMQSSLRRYNVVYLPGTENTPIMAGLPDGDMRTIAVPVPVGALPVAASLVRAAERADLRTPGSACLFFGNSTVEYVDARWPPLPSAYTASRDIFDVLHLPPARILARGSRPDGKRFLSVLRQHYTLVVQCPFRDVQRIIELMHGLGLVGTGEFPADPRWPNGAAYSAIVAPAGRALEGVSYDGLGGVLRVTYDPIVPTKSYLDFARALTGSPDVEPEPDTVRDLIARATHVSDGLLEKHAATT
jgi:hypothetical protein